MNAWPKLYPWATEWIQRFQDPSFQWSNLKPEDMDSKDLGFLYRPEYTIKFREAYDAAADYSFVLKKNLNFIQEEPYLASCLYDRWQQLWSRHSEHLPDENDRAWFLLAFQRLALLGSENRLTFHGVPKELWLTSTAGSFLSPPKPSDEIKQILFLNSAGQVCFWAYCASAPHHSSRQLSFSIPPENAQRILTEAVHYCTGSLDPSHIVFDGGQWNMELSNESNQEFRFASWLSYDHDSEESRFSQLLRSSLGMSDLLAIDGERRTFSKLQRLVLDCTETVSVPAAYRHEEDVPEYTVYHEGLTLDRISGTLERTLDDTEYHRYLFPEKVCQILDYISSPLFFQICDIPEEMLAPQSSCSSYTMILEWEDGTQKTLSGRYDQRGLPERFPELVNMLAFLLRPSYFNLLSSSFYGRKPRLKTDLIYCSVEFENSFNTYYYRTEDETLEEGDEVVVPAGKDNHLTIVTITEVEYYAPEDVPFPLEKTKMILRRCTAEDYKELGPVY